MIRRVLGLLSVSMLGLVAILAFFSPSSSSADTVQAASQKHVSYNGISFDYDASLAANVTVQTVPEQRAGPDTAWWMAHPEYTLFKFSGFPATGIWDPAISVFPVKSSYKYLNPPDEPVDIWRNGVDALRSLL